MISISNKNDFMAGVLCRRQSPKCTHTSSPAGFTPRCAERSGPVPAARDTNRAPARRGAGPRTRTHGAALERPPRGAVLPLLNGGGSALPHWLRHPPGWPISVPGAGGAVPPSALPVRCQRGGPELGEEGLPVRGPPLPERQASQRPRYPGVERLDQE